MESDEVELGVLTGATGRHHPWRFEPLREFLSRSDLWMYRSFVITPILVVATDFLVGAVLVVAAPAEAATTGVVVGWAVNAVVTTAVFTRWLLRGFDLAHTRERLELGLIGLTLVLQIWFTFQAGSEFPWRLLLLSSTAALLAVSVLGPLWMGLVYLAAIAGFMAAVHAPLPLIVAVTIMMAIYWYSTKLTLWYVDVMRYLAQARHAERRLAVSEERLRFADDLHDVIGRSLSIISVQAELADQLVARGDERARAHLQQVRTEVAQTMTQMRSLVRGYREPTVLTELEGARRLLESAGIRVHLEGEHTHMDPRVATMAGYLVREATTNILRHSQAREVTISVTPKRIRVVNDQPLPPSSDSDLGSGLETLRRKLVETGVGQYSDLEVHRGEDVFALTIHFTLPDEDGEHR